MSYVVEIVRSIKEPEVAALVERDPELSIAERGDGWMGIVWVRDQEEATFCLAQGRISVTTPSDKAWEKAEELARLLNAEVVGEEEQVYIPSFTTSGVFAGRSTWIGWPFLVVLLLALLVWRW